MQKKDEPTGSGSSESVRRLEAELQSKLQNSWVVRGSGEHESAGSEVIIETISRRITDPAGSGGPLRVIEHIESFSAEFQISFFRWLEVLVEGHISIPVARVVQTVAS